MLDNEEINVDGCASGNHAVDRFDAVRRRRKAGGRDAGSPRNFSRIRVDETPGALFAPEDAAALFNVDAEWLASKLAEPHPVPTVVINHHAPSRKSIHPRFADSLLNACFVSDAERLVDGRRTPLWTHGHTHDSNDYVHGTRVVCNPRGYARNGVNENPLFDANFLVEID